MSGSVDLDSSGALAAAPAADSEATLPASNGRAAEAVLASAAPLAPAPGAAGGDAAGPNGAATTPPPSLSTQLSRQGSMDSVPLTDEGAVDHVRP